MAETQRKKHFVLVHGASHGAWCWYKIRSMLETSGYKVTCLDFKGAGINQSDPDTILTLEDYSQPLINFMSNLPDNEKVIMVGHSAGDINLTDAIYRFGKKIEMAIYVAAPMLKHGFATDQDIKEGSSDLLGYEDVCQFKYGMRSDEAPTSVILKEEFQCQILYHMSPLEDSILASMLLRPGPIRPLSGRIDGKDEDAESVPRVYIKTMHDRLLKPEQQEAMIKKWPPSQVFVLNSEHSPFFSTPFDLFSFLVKAADSNKARL